MARVKSKIKNLKEFMFGDDQKNTKITIAVLGRTGVGKSTWINAFANYLQYDSFDEALLNEKVYVPVYSKFLYKEIEERSDSESSNDEDDEKTASENFTNLPFKSIAVGDPGSLYDEDRSVVESATSYPCSYTLKNEDKVEVTIIDTPGLGDTFDVMTDDTHIKAILDHFSMYEVIDAFVILLKPDEHRISQEFLYTIRKIFNQLHKSAKSNVVFAFTHSRNTDFMDGDTFHVLTKVLHKMELEIEINNKNRFYFDNSPFRYLAVCAKSHVPTKQRSLMQEYWKKSSRNFVKLLKYVKSLEPHNTSATISIHEVRLNINIMTEPLIEICKSIKRTSFAILSAIKTVNESLQSQGKTKVLSVKGQELVYKPLASPQTVCSNEECSREEVFKEQDGSEVRKKIYDPICCKGCWLPMVPVERKGAFQLHFCWSLKSRTCKECSHQLKEHMHVTYELERIDKIIQGNTESLHLQLSEMEFEYNEIVAACGLFMYYLKQNELAKLRDSITADLEEAMKKERLKDNDEEKVTILHELQIRYEMEYNCLSGTEVPTPTEIQKRMQSLFELKHNGEKLKTIFDGIKDIHRRYHLKNAHNRRSYSLSEDDKDSLPSVKFHKAVECKFEIEEDQSKGGGSSFFGRIWGQKK